MHHSPEGRAVLTIARASVFLCLVALDLLRDRPVDPRPVLTHPRALLLLPAAGAAAGVWSGDLALFLATGNVLYEIPRHLDLAEDADLRARCLCNASREAWQLCHVLPPGQAHLLPDADAAVRRAMTDARFGAAHFYPVAFARTSYLVPANAPAHLRVPILPIFDDQVLANAIIRAGAAASAQK